MKQSVRLIRLFSRCLGYLCIFGIVIGPLLNGLYWIYDGHCQLLQIKNTKFYLQFANSFLPPPVSEMTFSLKLEGFFIDLIPCVFYIALLFTLYKLFKRFEKLEFFTKKNIQYIRQIGIILLLNQLIYPFYIALRNYILFPPQEIIRISFGPLELKSFFLVFIVFLAAQVMEAGRHFEEEYQTIV